MNTAQHSSVVRELVPLLFVDDIQSCAAFYTDKLGFTMHAKWEPDGELTWCKLRRDGSAIMLQQACNEDGPISVRGRGIIFYFNCHDVDARYAEVVARGLTVNLPQVVFYGEKQLSLRDPDGYGLCFQSPATQE
jgi:glyoxylase I family protein